MLFKCKICAEREIRIADLNKQIEFYKRLLIPNPHLPMINTEADKLLEGGGNDIINMSIITEEQAQQARDIEAESIRILTGTY